MATGITSSSLSERQLVTFLLGEDEFGTDIMDVKEIIRVPDITKVPNAPRYVVGACNLRGNVLPIIDGRTRFGLDKKENDENSRVLVIDVDGNATGVVVDKVLEVMRITSASIEQAPQIVKNTESDYLNGVVKLESGNRLVMLLDIVSALRVGDRSDEQADMQKNNTADTVVQNSENGPEIIDEEQLVSFLLNNEEYAVGIMKVNEIIRLPQIVKVPDCADYVVGVVSLRNNLLPIINLRTFFGLSQTEVNDHTRILVVDIGSYTVGIMVDKIYEVLRVPTKSIQPPPKFSVQNNAQLTGVAKLNDGNRIILILDPSRLVSQSELENMGTGISEHDQAETDKSAVGQVLDEQQLVTFRLGIEEYGINVENVQEINRMTEVTKIPRAPQSIEGIVNLRGNVVPALDLRRLFNLSEKQVTDSTRIIIVDLDGKSTGLIVDSVSEVLRFERSLIEPPPVILSSGIDSDFVDGVGKLEDGKRMILILNIGKVLHF